MDRLRELTENATSGANFDETRGIVEAQSPVQVTANSSVNSGLDKGGPERMNWNRSQRRKRRIR